MVILRIKQRAKQAEIKPKNLNFKISITASPNKAQLSAVVTEVILKIEATVMRTAVIMMNKIG